MLTTNDGCRLHVVAPAASDGAHSDALIFSNSLGTDVSLWDRKRVPCLRPGACGATTRAGTGSRMRQPATTPSNVWEGICSQ